MRLKRTIQLIEYSNMALVIGLLIIVFAFVAKSPDGKILIFELLFSMPFILSFIFRQVIITQYLKKSKYPGVFFSVIEKLGLTKNTELNLPDHLLDDMYKPSYSTAQFLNDNNLKTEIGLKKVNTPFEILILMLSIIAFFYVGEKYTFRQNPVAFIVMLILIVISGILLVKNKSQENDVNAVLKFTEKGILSQNNSYDWKNIYDWSYKPEGRGDSVVIIIN